MNLAALDLNLLVVFDALMAERHVTRAGESIGLSQPAMSNALGRLRHVFDDPLFVRAGGRMEPTARAIQIAEPVRAALLQLQSALAGAGPFDPATVSRRFVLASTDFTELLILPMLMERLDRQAPGIDVSFRAADRISARALIEAGEVDVALVPFSEEVTDLRSVPLFQERFLTIAARDHPDLRSGLTFERFLELPQVLVSVEGRGTALLDNLLAARGLRRRIALTVPHFTMVPFIVGAGRAIATLPARIARRLADAADVALYEPPLPVGEFTLHAVWHRRHDNDPGHRWMREQIAAIAGDL